MLRISIINPPYFPRYSRSQRSPGVIRSGTLYFPYWLAHATAVLQEAGFECLLIDCPASGASVEQLLQQLEGFSPDLLVLDTSTASFTHDCLVALNIKEKFPRSSICLVGTHASATWKESIENHPQIDYIAIGEYDYTVRDLATLIENSELSAVPLNSLRLIEGLAFRDTVGAASRGPERPLIENVDELPWIAPVYKQFLNPRHYSFTLASHPMVMLIGGRGCVSKCTFCVYPQVMHGHRYRTRSPASIVGEMEWIQENMPEVKEIVFEDDTFTSDRIFARTVADLVRTHGIRLPWFANIRCNVDRETLMYLKESGFRCCAVGFESGDETLLKNMLKGQSLEQQKEFIKNCRELKILVHGCFMVGFPGETKETMEKTFKLAVELQPDSAQFYPAMPFPGTSYYNWAKSNGYLTTENFNEWLTPKGAHQCVVNLPGLSATDLEQFCESAYRRFYFRLPYFAYKIRQALCNPVEGIRSIRAFFEYLLSLCFVVTERFMLI